ncbi:maleylpyruvate isomerase family mycothiol-dependent enzyme [Actinoplanes sp. NPDC048988]|uniref:maleylpyruvate isomerase family mycothiol-dependent enzyme n=1 Tax=Actinoplanes sp. NPDC048988 TaxID=3363901 RepID=UPI003718A4EE
MRIEDYLDTLRRDGELVAEAAGRTGLDAVVPACPGWQVRDVLLHLGGVHRWAAAHVADRLERPGGEEGFFTRVGDEALIDWFRSGHSALVGTLAGADPELTCWSFMPAPSPLAFWARRQAHETAVHRADVESADGATPAWAPAFAVDGVEELLRGFFGRGPERMACEPPVTIALTATDAEAAWTLRMDAGGLHVADGAAPATTLTLSGAATDLYLLLWNRGGPDQLAVDGDLGALDAWRSRATVSWS